MSIRFPRLPRRARRARSLVTRLLSAGLLTAGLFASASPALAQFKVPTPKVPTPKVQTPKVPTPKVQLPKTPAPKIQPPKVSAPKLPSAKVTLPKVQTPKVPDASKIFQTPSGNSTQFSGGGQKTTTKTTKTAPPKSTGKKTPSTGPSLGNTAAGEPIRTKKPKTTSSSQPSTSTTTKVQRPGKPSTTGAAVGGAIAGAVGGAIIGSNLNNDRPPPVSTRPAPPPQFDDEPQAPSPSAPPRRNTVVREPAARLENARFELLNEDFDQLETEFAGREVAELGEAGAKIDAALAADLDKIPGLTPAQKQEAIEAWRDAVLSGDPEKYKEFKKKFESLLPAGVTDMVSARIEILEMQSDILDGKLDGLDERLQKLTEQVNGWGPSPLKEGLSGSLAEATKFHELCQLASLARQREDALRILLEGVVAAGFEPEFLAEASGLPIVTVDAASDSPGTQVAILLLNPDSNSRTVSYQLDGDEFSMQPGHKQVLTRSRRITIENPAGAEDVEYDLSSGVYEFVRDGGAWDVSRIEPRVVIDNTRYRGDFHYTVNGESAVVQAGEAVEHSSDDALVIEFDRGDDSPPARKVFGTGHFVVGVDAGRQRLDLFDIRRLPSDLEDESSQTDRADDSSTVRTERRSDVKSSAARSTSDSAKQSSKAPESRRKEIDQVLERLRQRKTQAAPAAAPATP